MRCPGCETDNREGRAFCSGCGGKLAAACARCGFSNEPGEKFCGGCGAPVNHEAQRKPGERRQVSVLFADLSGYTSLSGQLDPEETHQLLERFFDVVDGVVARFGGTIDKHIGDNVMALFGAPVAHGNDPERAARAALAIHTAVATLSSELGRKLQVHIGVAAGEVMASGLGSRHYSEYTVLGSSVNLAARLQDKAGAGETFIDDAVYRAIADRVMVEPVGELALKGVAATVRTWKLLKFSAAPDVGHRPIIGRDRELEQLRRALLKARDHRGGWVHLRGEAGIGKSRILREARALAEGLGFVSAAGQFLDFGVGEGDDAIATMVRGLLDGATADEARSWLPAELVPALCDVVGEPISGSELRLYQETTEAARQDRREAATVATLRHACALQPRLVLLEDLHWIRPEQVPLLAGFIAALSSDEVVVVTSSRPGGDPVGISLRGDPTILEVEPLSPGESLELMRAFGAAAISEAMITRAGGNPLFLEQLIDAGIDAGSELPPSVRSLVAARVDRLGAADRAAIGAAAVLGQRFSMATVRRVIQVPGYSPQGLVDHHLIAELADDEWGFRHALIQEGVYAAMTRGHRRSLHQAAAAAVDDPLLRAEQLDRAEDPGAARAYFQAATAASHGHRFEQAIRLATRGESLAQLPDESHDLAMLIGLLFRDVGDGAGSQAALQRAVAVAPDAAARLRALVEIGHAYRLLGEHPAALRALDEADEVARDVAEARIERSRIHYLRGSVYFSTGKHQQSEHEHRRALELARELGNQALEARACSGLGDVEYARNALDRSRVLYARAVQLCEEAGLERDKAINRVMLAFPVFVYGGAREARAALELALGEARRIGDRYAEALVLVSHGFFAAMGGEFVESAAFARAGLDVARPLGARRFCCEALCVLAETSLMSGNRLEAGGFAREAVELSRALGMAYLGASALTLLGWSLEGEPRAAAFAEAGQVLAAGALSHNFGASYHMMIEENLVEGQLDEVEPWCQALEKFGGDQPLWTLVAARGRLLARFARGQDVTRELQELRVRRDAFGYCHVLPGDPPETWGALAGLLGGEAR
jgi:class 3 adenylate cyclase/predicted ATPase